ncbi:putative cytochrome P450 [Helianthus annuus]|uniref:Cytochrome P450 n=1 Tax=Helianthus annuus TaxID=4232 RepID=A0A251TZE7_HELAN|nr:cytochrome P450 83B1 [Helianthus annuus]KAF5792572.1 putative cytochrome P450 [Helianthus annuus]KAJ0527502.1 putative cytochrome P450 [Helianthus annuus]KAJ0536236.1 putative cytochrome P450 [Helianthus annuus]KAJ0543911.1 putative cytochrome P450 [Helianthus annuus]KAJ0708965.1 putative cytochrome P450 [Helianthus annuus]
MDSLIQFLLVSLLFLSFIYLLPKIVKTKSKTSRPPGPRGLPFIGNMHQIDNSSLHTSLWKLSKSYGPIVSLNLGFIPAIVVSSASLAKEILKTQDHTFCSRPLLHGIKKIGYNGHDVALSPYNRNWKEMRKIFSVYLFSPKRIQSSRYIREDEVSRAMKKIHGLALSSNHVNLSVISHIVMSTIVTRVGFGKRYEEGDKSKEILRLLHELQATITNYFLSDLWPGSKLAGLIDRMMGKFYRLEKCFKDLDSFYQELIDEHLHPQNPKSSEGEHDLIDILLQLKKDHVLDPFELTNDHIKAIITDILVAGTDNSAATLVWAMTSLIKNPKEMKKVQEEVRNAVGDKGKVDEDDLSKLTYMKAVVKEVLRLYPAAPLLIPRETTEDTIIHGYKIKKKTIVYVNALAIGRDPGSWENPEEFSPERFLNSDIGFKGNDFELIPFGAGRRICPGISMGVLEVELLLANLIYLFDWGLPDGMKKEDIDLEVMPGLTMTNKEDLCLLAQVYSGKAMY